MFVDNLCFHSVNKYCLSSFPIPSTLWVSLPPLWNICTYQLPIFPLSCFPFSKEFFLCFGNIFCWLYVLQISPSLWLAFLLYSFFFPVNTSSSFYCGQILFLHSLLKALEFYLSNLRPYFHLKCILMFCMKKGSNFFLFIFSLIWRTNPSDIIIEWSLLYLLIYNDLFSMGHAPMYKYGSVSGFSLLFHCSICFYVSFTAPLC